MIEKRKHVRVPITLHLSISDLYKDNPVISGIHNLHSPIELVDISQNGVAFISECVLPTGYYFNASFESDDHLEKVFTVVKIIHSRVIEHSRYQYGCEFSTKPENFKEFLSRIELHNQL